MGIMTFRTAARLLDDPVGVRCARHSSLDLFMAGIAQRRFVILQDHGMIGPVRAMARKAALLGRGVCVLEGLHFQRRYLMALEAEFFRRRLQQTSLGGTVGIVT